MAFTASTDSILRFVELINWRACERACKKGMSAIYLRSINRKYEVVDCLFVCGSARPFLFSIQRRHTVS